jgi:hypothetical protein
MHSEGGKTHVMRLTVTWIIVFMWGCMLLQSAWGHLHGCATHRLVSTVAHGRVVSRFRRLMRGEFSGSELDFFLEDYCITERNAFPKELAIGVSSDCFVF